jgi:hypothetical protein
MSQFFVWLKAITTAILILTLIAFIPLLISGLGIVLCVGVLALICKDFQDPGNR